MADVPGLIEGASDGVGLGHEFLAHLERARLLVHVVDAAEEDVEARFRTIQNELARYGAGLAERPQLVVLNKIDLLAEVPRLETEDPRIVRVVATSCATGEGIEALRHALFELCGPQIERAAPGEQLMPDFLEYRPRVRRRPPFRILRTDRGYRVVGTPPSSDELEEALRRIGVKRGAAVEIGGEELEWH